MLIFHFPDFHRLLLVQSGLGPDPVQIRVLTAVELPGSVQLLLQTLERVH